MKKALQKMLDSTKGAMNLGTAIVEIVLVVTLVPVIAVIIAEATNLTSTEETLLGLVTLFIVIGLVFGIAKSSGMMNKR